MLLETLKTVHSLLEQAEIDHALIGGFALAALGIHRATADIDFLIDGHKKDSAIQTLQKAKFILELSSNEVLHFKGPVNIDFLIARRSFSLDMLHHSTMIPSLQIKCLLPEDIIGLKIQSYVNDKTREFQDKADILAIIQKFPNLDWTRIKRYADLFDEWQTLQSFSGKKP